MDFSDCRLEVESCGFEFICKCVGNSCEIGFVDRNVETRMNRIIVDVEYMGNRRYQLGKCGGTVRTSRGRFFDIMGG